MHPQTLRWSKSPLFKGQSRRFGLGGRQFHMIRHTGMSHAQSSAMKMRRDLCRYRFFTFLPFSPDRWDGSDMDKMPWRRGGEAVTFHFSSSVSKAAPPQGGFFRPSRCVNGSLAGASTLGRPRPKPESLSNAEGGLWEAKWTLDEWSSRAPAPAPPTGPGWF